LSGRLRGSASRSPGAEPRCRSRSYNWMIRGRLRSRGQPLAGDAPRNAKPDAECAADGLRSHPVYDGSSDPRQHAFKRRRLNRLRPGWVGSKVERSCAASRASHCAGRRFWR
jgi:hypothetical protein